MGMVKGGGNRAHIPALTGILKIKEVGGFMENQRKKNGKWFVLGYN